MTAQIPAETLATWRARARKAMGSGLPVWTWAAVVRLVDALAAETARAEAAEAKVEQFDQHARRWMTHLRAALADPKDGEH